MAKHTAIPWEAVRDTTMASPDRFAIYADHAPSGYKMPAECNGPAAEANASFIVQACNHHEELVKACKLALKRLERLGAEDDVATAGPCPACEAIRTVLAKIEGK